MTKDSNFTFEEVANGVDTFVRQASAAGAESIVIADALVTVGLALAAAETKLDADYLVRRYVSERDKT